MADRASRPTLPSRRLFKAAEVCSIARVQPYVLRSWESEFPDLGLAKTPGGPRVYRRADVERVLEIRELVFNDGMTLAGVRRHLEHKTSGPEESPDEEAVASWIDAEVRARLRTVRHGLRELAEMLGAEPGANGSSDSDFALQPQKAAPRKARAAEGRRPRRPSSPSSQGAG